MNAEQIAENLSLARERIAAAARRAGRDPADISLLCATKTQSDETIRAVIRAGAALCGENRVQEFTAHLQTGAYTGSRVHFIGHLQTNKVKYVVGKVELIHSISSEKLLRAVDERAGRLGLVQDVLLEVNVGGEESKSGFSPQETPEAAALAAALPHVRLCGLMCIPPAGTSERNRSFFSKLRTLAVDIRPEMGDNVTTCLSMGMSGDFEDAIAEGATIVRLGSALFGPRPAPGHVDR